MLMLNNITKQFHGKNIVDNVSLTVRNGEIALLLGSSGVGKSTLLRILNNLEKIDNGSITLNGKPLNLTRVNQEHSVGMVFQNFNLFEHLTALENITLVLEKVAHKTKTEALSIAHALLKKYGLDDKAQLPITRLSGGQKQRLALARTLALKPTIICLDEPTSALDPLLTTHVATTIQELAAAGYIVLVATHDTALLEQLPCTIHLMRNGTIIESAASREFFANKAAYPHINNFISGKA